MTIRDYQPTVSGVEGIGVMTVVEVLRKRPHSTETSESRTPETQFSSSSPKSRIQRVGVSEVGNERLVVSHLDIFCTQSLGLKTENGRHPRILSKN